MHAEFLSTMQWKRVMLSKVLWVLIIKLMIKRRICWRFGRTIVLVGGLKRRTLAAVCISLGRIIEAGEDGF